MCKPSMGWGCSSWLEPLACLNPEVLSQPQGRRREDGGSEREGGRGEGRGRDINVRVPLLMLVVKGVFASDTGLAFTLSSVVPHYCVPIVLPQCYISAPAASHLHAPAVIYLCTTLVFPRCHLCAPMELKLFNFVLAALPGSPLPPGSCVLKGHTTLCCMRTFRCAFPAKGSVVLVCEVNWQQADH